MKRTTNKYKYFFHLFSGVGGLTNILSSIELRSVPYTSKYIKSFFSQEHVPGASVFSGDSGEGDRETWRRGLPKARLAPGCVRLFSGVVYICVGIVANR